MIINHPDIKFERYADDTICHCKTYFEAKNLFKLIIDRFEECGLVLNADKTKIVYCKDKRRKLDYSLVSFDFLGHAFRPRKSMNRNTRIAFTSFLPAISNKSKKRIKDTVRSWCLKSKSHTLRFDF